MSSGVSLPIYMNQQALRRLMWGSVAWVLAFLLLALYTGFSSTDDDFRRHFYAIFFLISSVGGVIAGLQWFKKSKRREATMTLTTSGLQIHDGILKNLGEIAWRDIGSVDFRNVRKESYYVFSSVNRQLYLDRFNRDDLQKYQKQFVAFGGAVLVWVPFMNVHYEKKEFLQLIEGILAKSKQ